MTICLPLKIDATPFFETSFKECGVEYKEKLVRAWQKIWANNGQISINTNTKNLVVKPVLFKNASLLTGTHLEYLAGYIKYVNSCRCYSASSWYCDEICLKETSAFACSFSDCIFNKKTLKLFIIKCSTVLKWQMNLMLKLLSKIPSIRILLLYPKASM